MKHTQLILTAALLSLMTAGCAKEMKADGAQTAAVAAAPVVNPTFPVNAPPGQGAGTAGDNWSYGASADLTPDSFEIFNTYSGKPLNNPTNLKLNVNLMDVGEGHFGGALKIAYDDAGKHHEGYFMTAGGKNTQFDSYNMASDVGLYYAQYNTWFNDNKNFSGFFQDSAGAVVLVIDSVLNQGDGQGGNLVSGSVWFKNFETSLYDQSGQLFGSPGSNGQINRYCWFISGGPYDCRSTSMMDKSSPYPSDGYRKLGSFTQLARSKAFNQ